MVSRPVCCLLLAPALLLVMVCWMMHLFGVPDTEPGHTWSTTGVHKS